MKERIKFSKLAFFLLSLACSLGIFYSVSLVSLYLERENQDRLIIKSAIQRAEKLVSLDPNLRFERALMMVLGTQKIGIFSSDCFPIFVNDLSLNHKICSQRLSRFSWFEFETKRESFLIGMKKRFRIRSFISKSWPSIQPSFTAYFIFTTTFIFLTYFFFISQPAKDISKQIELFLASKKPIQFSKSRLKDSIFSDLYGCITDLILSVSKFHKEEGVLQVARQVTHDLRGPLAIINDQIALGQNANFKLIKSSVMRIEDICGDLLIKSKPRANVICWENIISEIEEVFNHYRISSEIISTSDLGRKVQSGISETELYRFLSNVIKNAAEAKATKCIISIHIQEAKCNLKIKDNGLGTNPSFIPKIIAGNYSTKSYGNGIGISSMNSKLININGELSISSRLGEGFEIQISFPIKNYSIESIVLIDNDKYIGLNWANIAKSKSIAFRHFLNFDQFDKFIPKISLDTSIFIDLNLDGENGLDIAKTLHDLGYNQLHIATGFFPPELNNPPYILSVRDKTFPI